MKVSQILPAAGFVLCANALAVENRAVSNNNCGRAVAGTAKGPVFMASARSDCSKNVIATTTLLITPLPSTFVQTSVAQESVYSTISLTSPTTTSTTTTSLATETETSISTTYFTSFVDEVTTVVVPTTVLVTSVYTITETSAAAVATALVPRVASPVTPTIPAYASSCRDFAEYAAACSFAGVAPGTVTVYSTLPAVTFTSVKSITSTATILTTQTVVSTIDVTVSKVATVTTVQSLTKGVSTTLVSTQTSLSTVPVLTVTVPVATTVTVAAPPPANTNVLLNGGFEDPSSPWTVMTPPTSSTQVTLNFEDTSTAAHGGKKTGSITQNQYFTPVVRFYHPMTVVPDTEYIFKAWVKTSINGFAGCVNYFYIGDEYGNSIYSLANAAIDIRPDWWQASASWKSQNGISKYTLIVYLNCAASVPGRVFYFDDISLIAAP